MEPDAAPTVDTETVAAQPADRIDGGAAAADQTPIDVEANSERVVVEPAVGAEPAAPQTITDPTPAGMRRITPFGEDVLIMKEEDILGVLAA